MNEHEIKARELVIKLQFQNPPLMFDIAKQCALIAVDEIISEFEYNSTKDHKQGYWQSVKQEIENL